jgi:hypothetical protein
MVLVFAAELGLGLGLIGTAVKFGRDWPTLPATVVRTGTALFFLVALGALNEMRQRHPDAGCGCFGELSGTPIGLRTIAARACCARPPSPPSGLPPLRMPSSSAEAELWLAVLAFELALIAFLSPELSEIMVRLGYSEPCELRRMPVGRTMSALHASSQWRRYADQVSARSPSDVWREGCWGSSCTRDTRAAGRSTSSSPSTCSHAGPPSAQPFSTRTPTRCLAPPGPASLPFSRRL